MSQEIEDKRLSELDRLSELMRLVDMDDAEATQLLQLIRLGDASEPDVGRGADLRTIGSYVGSRTNPCLLVRSDGHILDANDRARVLMRNAALQSVDHVGLTEIDGADLSRQVAMSTGGNGAGDGLRAGRLRIERTGAVIPYLIIRIEQQGAEHPQMAIMILGDGGPPTERFAAIAAMRDLSRSEAEVTQLFVSGKSLSEIAQQRGRSLATVRKQFYTICEKFGVSSQSELLRVVFDDAGLLAKAQDVTDQPSYPDRMTAQVLRPGGRVVEVIISGDLGGLPVILLPSAALRTWPAATEAMFRQAGIRMISVVAPQQGATSPTPAGQSRTNCYCGDVLAVMDQLGVGQATILSSNFGLRQAVAIARRFPDRINQIICQSVGLPQNAVKPEQDRVTVVSSLQELVRSSKTLKRLALRAVSMSFAAMSAEQAIKVMHRNSPRTVASYMKPENFTEISEAIRSIFAQGSEVSRKTFDKDSIDWTADIIDCETPIALIIGLSSDLHHAAAVRQFVETTVPAVSLVDISARRLASIFDGPEILVPLVQQASIGAKTLGNQ